MPGLALFQHLQMIPQIPYNILLLLLLLAKIHSTNDIYTLLHVKMVIHVFHSQSYYLSLEHYTETDKNFN